MVWFMRLLLAVVAVMALLVNPVAAAAAQVACETSQAMAPMDHGDSAKMAASGMDHQAMAIQKDGTDPCCDHHGPQKMDDKSCALACASACAIVVALPYTPFSLALAYTRAPETVAQSVWAKPYDPLGLERPPKSMA
jgi:uncharacterized protein involved in copper resistance